MTVTYLWPKKAFRIKTTVEGTREVIHRYEVKPNCRLFKVELWGLVLLRSRNLYIQYCKENHVRKRREVLSITTHPIRCDIEVPWKEACHPQQIKENVNARKSATVNEIRFKGSERKNLYIYLSTGSRSQSWLSELSDWRPLDSTNSSGWLSINKSSSSEVLVVRCCSLNRMALQNTETLSVMKL